MNLHGNEYIAVSSIILLAALAQSITGFGFSIVAMSFLPGVVGLHTSVPLVTLVCIVGNIVILSMVIVVAGLPQSLKVISLLYFSLVLPSQRSPMAGMEI